MAAFWKVWAWDIWKSKEQILAEKISKDVTDVKDVREKDVMPAHAREDAEKELLKKKDPRDFVLSLPDGQATLPTGASGRDIMMISHWSPRDQKVISEKITIIPTGHYMLKARDEGEPPVAFFTLNAAIERALTRPSNLKPAQPVPQEQRSSVLPPDEAKVAKAETPQAKPGSPMVVEKRREPQELPRVPQGNFQGPSGSGRLDSWKQAEARKNKGVLPKAETPQGPDSPPPFTVEWEKRRATPPKDGPDSPRAGDKKPAAQEQPVGRGKQGPERPIGPGEEKPNKPKYY